MFNISTFDARKAIKDAAEAKGDADMLAKISGVDLIAAEARYHNACRARYTSKTNLKYMAFKEGKGEDVYANAFQELMSSVDSGIQQGKAYELTSLLTRYKSILRNKDASTAESYTSQRLKLRLKNHFKDRVVFHEQHQQSKSQLMYSSQISLQEVFTAACSTPHTDQDSRTSTHKGTEPDSMQTLYHAAQIIRSELKECTGIGLQPLSLHDLVLTRGKDLIPKGLYNFLRWVVCKESDPLPATEDATAADERHIIMLGQDIIHSASHGRVKTPKHVGLAMSVRHMTGSKTIINILNRMGHFIV